MPETAPVSRGWADLALLTSGSAPPAVQPRALDRVTVDDIIWAQGRGWTGQPIGLPAVYGAVRLIASTIAQLPVVAHQGTTDVALPTWLRRPRRYGSALELGDLVQLLVSGMALRGVAYLACTRTGESWRLDALNPDQVDTQVGYDRVGRITLTHRVAGTEMPAVPPNSGDASQGRTYLLHMPYLTTPDQPQGVGPLQAARMALDGYLATEQHAAHVFESGLHSGGRLETDQELAPATAQRYRERWMAARKTGEIPVLGSGLRYVNDLVNPRDAEWIEARQFNQAQIWLMFGIPPDYMGATMTGGSSSLSYSNAQDNDTRFRRNCLSAFTQQIESSLSMLLPPGRDASEDHYVTFDYTGWEAQGRADDTLPAADDQG